MSCTDDQYEDLVAAVMADREYTAVTISPDNTLLGWISAGTNGPALSVDVLSKDGTPHGSPRTVYDDGGLRGYVFLHDGTSILLLLDEVGDENTRAVLLDRTTGALSDPLTPADSQARFLVHRAEFPTTVFLAVNDRDAALHDVVTLCTRTHELNRIAMSPGYDSWIIDQRGTVRGGTRMADDASTVIELHPLPSTCDQPGHPRLTWKFPPEVAGASGIRGLTASPTPSGSDRAWILDGNMGDPAPLVEYALEPDGARIVTVRHFPAEVDGTWTAPGTGQPAAVEYGRWFQTVEPLEPVTSDKLTRLWERLAEDAGEAGASRGGQCQRPAIHADRRDRHGDVLWSLTVDPLTGPPRCGVWNSETDNLHWLPPQLPGLTAMPALRTEAFEATARDGLPIPGYITVADADLDKSAMPAVVLVHGGPWERDEASFDAEAALLAHAGFAVLRVNYRGSVGFGSKHLTAGFEQWGLRMSDDLDDAVEHMISTDRIDPERVAIMGASYGGYAALMAGCRDGFGYACAIAAMAPTDLRLLIDGIPDYWRPLRAILTERVGDPETQSELLDAASPIHRLHSFCSPLLLAHGVHDPRVPTDHVDQLVAQLRGRGIPHEALIFDDEGHGLVHEANRVRYYVTVLRFLNEHLHTRRKEQL